MKEEARPTRIATYLRARNPEGLGSAPAQRQAFAHWLAEHPEVSAVAAFEDLDDDASQELACRPGWGALLAAVDQGRIDGVLVRSVDRLSRYRPSPIEVVLERGIL